MAAPLHTVIYTRGGGRLGNQVIRFLNWIAWVRAHPEMEVLNFSFWPFAAYFSFWREHPSCIFPPRLGWVDHLARWRAAYPEWARGWTEKRSWLQRAVQTMGHWRPGWQAVTLDIAQGESIDLDSPAFLAQVTRKAVTTCSGWRISSWRLVTEQQNELRDFFRPSLRFAVPAEKFMSGLRQRHDFLIGLFIRQSDYRSWEDGRFYFPTQRYVEWIKELVKLYAGCRIAILIASEERQDPDLFAGLPCYFTTGSPHIGQPWFESWIELSSCDIIVSPPSTFSATAAFLGSVPLWPLCSAEQAMNFNQIISDGLIGAARHPVFSRAVK